MNKSLLAIAAITLTTMFTAAPAEAAKKNKANRDGHANVGRILSRFDRNNDGSLDQRESEHVRRFFGAVKSLDSDKNGELSDSEITAAKIEKRQKKGTASANAKPRRKKQQ
jgi:hypothetical protein